MNEPVINKFPTEVFGCPYVGQPKQLQSAIQQQSERCFKQRRLCKILESIKKGRI